MREVWFRDKQLSRAQEDARYYHRYDMTYRLRGNLWVYYPTSKSLESMQRTHPDFDWREVQP